MTHPIMSSTAIDRCAREFAQRRQPQAKQALSLQEAEEIVLRMKTENLYGWLSLALMKVDPTAQRKLRPTWVKRRVHTFDANQIGTIVISRRADGSLWILDGQHRVELLRAVGWGDQAVYCEIFDGLSIQEEAALFRLRNDKVSVRVFDKFSVLLTEQNEAACAIARIVSSCGLTIAEGNRDGYVSAVTALQRVYSGGGIASEAEGGIALKRALRTIDAAWGKPAANYQGLIIEGLGIVHLRYGNEIDFDALVGKLAKVVAGANGLIGLSKALRDLHGGSAPFAVGAIIVQRYNYGRRSGKLAGWWS